MHVIDRYGEQAALFGRMAERHGVDWSNAVGLPGALAIRRAAVACLSCPRETACRRGFWDRPDETVPADFCPNAALFDAWAARRR